MLADLLTMFYKAAMQAMTMRDLIAFWQRRNERYDFKPSKPLTGLALRLLAVSNAWKHDG